MDRAAIVTKLRRRCNTPSTQTAVADDLGISVSYLNDVLKGRREPGAKLLTALGLERHVTYRPIR